MPAESPWSRPTQTRNSAQRASRLRRKSQGQAVMKSFPPPGQVPRQRFLLPASGSVAILNLQLPPIRNLSSSTWTTATKRFSPSETFSHTRKFLRACCTLTRCVIHLRALHVLISSGLHPISSARKRVRDASRDGATVRLEEQYSCQLRDANCQPVIHHFEPSPAQQDFVDAQRNIIGDRCCGQNHAAFAKTEQIADGELWAPQFPPWSCSGASGKPRSDWVRFPARAECQSARAQLELWPFTCLVPLIRVTRSRNSANNESAIALPVREARRKVSDWF